MSDEKHPLELQIERLRATQHQVDFLLSYHTRMLNETSDFPARELHQFEASELKEARASIEKLLEELEHPQPS
jgi:hypothetical protein